MKNVFEKFRPRAIDLSESKLVLGGADEECCECDGASGDLIYELGAPNALLLVEQYVATQCGGNIFNLVCNPY